MFLRVGVLLVELGQEAMGEIPQDVFARRNVDLEVAPFLGRDFGKPAFHQLLAGRNDLDDRGMAAFKSRSTAPISDGVLIAVMRWLKKRCLALSKADRAADLASRSAGRSAGDVRRPMAALRSLWMIEKASA